MSSIPAATRGKKRSHSEAIMDRDSSSNKDPIVGLNVCGKMYYCHQSTLVNASPYFASRFKGDFSATVAYTDPQGHDVYFVERPPTTFPYIFEFIVSGGCHELPCFQKNPKLVRNLRVEADFFGLDSLTEKLKVTKSIIPLEGNRGVLYWLGTEKGTAPYENPFALGAIHVGGWMEDEANRGKYGFNSAHPAHCRCSFVQYRELPVLANVHENDQDDDDDWREPFDATNELLWCYHAVERLPVVLELKSLSLRPTHYSLRTSQCYGMSGDWNLEGSEDGTTWEVLHAARNDQNLLTYLSSDPEDMRSTSRAKAKVALSGGGGGKKISGEEKRRRALEMLEKEFRYTWELYPPPTNFYRCFRIIGASAPEQRVVNSGCLHGEGIELFGDIYEE